MKKPAHIQLDAYVPEHYTKEGYPVIHNVSIKIQSDDMQIESIVEAMENFLVATGYIKSKPGYKLKLIEEKPNE